MDRLDKAILLEKGAAVIDEKGWFEMGAYQDHETERVCMLGAVRIAAFGTVTFSEAMRDGATEDQVEAHYFWECDELSGVLAQVVDNVRGPISVTYWNDTECPGGPEAAETLRKMGAWYREQGS